MCATSLLLCAPPTRLVDRLDEVEAIRGLLTVDRVRLLTITGPAGVGKTRLALAAVAPLTQHFPDGVTLVDLAPVRDPALVLPTAASMLGVADISSAPLSARLQTYLRERTQLIVLDNFEQVRSTATELGDLLAECPGLSVLVTSRVPLQVRFEQVLRIAPLPVPDLRALPPLDELAQIASVALFLERARARRSTFALSEAHAHHVAQVAVHLDGLPLALELAAAQLDALPLSSVVRWLEDRLQLLQWAAIDLPARQRSLEAAMGWSYDLLSEQEQRYFRAIGVFRGHVTAEALLHVVSPRPDTAPLRADDEAPTLQGLISLTEKSLILRGREEDSDEDTVTFAMLETVHEYARKQLERNGELEAALRAHARHFLALAEQADEQLRGPDQRRWYLRLERERDNLRAALQWLLERDGVDAVAERDAALRLAGALGWFWSARGYHTEGMRWMEQALAHDRKAASNREGDPAAGAAYTRALIGAGEFLAYQGNVELARSVLEEALALARWRENRTDIAQALNYLGTAGLFAGEVTAAIPLLQEALDCARDLHDPHPSGIALFLLGLAANAQGDDVGAVSRYEQALSQLEAAGDARVAAHVRFNLAGIIGQQGDVIRAVAIVRTGLAACATLQDSLLLTTGVRVTLALAGEHGDPTRSARLLGAADALTEATGATLSVAERVAADQVVAALRDHLTQDDMAAAYREGHALSFGDVVALSLTLLDNPAGGLPPAPLYPATQTLLRPEPVPQAQLPGENPLTEREREVLRLVGQGLSSKLIAHQLGIAPSTVNYHLATIFNKLAADTRAQAVAVATQRGLL